MTRLQRWTQALAAIPEKAVTLIGNLPTTNLRIVVTLALVVGTGLVYLAIALTLSLRIPMPDAQPIAPWEPSGEWLTFLAAMSGLDALQFTTKRMTHRSDGGGAVDPERGG